MSYDLHKELSDKFGGAEKWGYRTVETLVRNHTTRSGPLYGADIYSQSIPTLLDPRNEVHLSRG